MGQRADSAGEWRVGLSWCAGRSGTIGVVTAGQSASSDLVVGSVVFSAPPAALVLFMVVTQA
ncbi:hypothetical protein EQV97_15760 [Pseudomonas sp. TMW22090]|nr:hypothetical protein [Pseudomonas sp. TMW22090]